MRFLEVGYVFFGGRVPGCILCIVQSFKHNMYKMLHAEKDKIAFCSAPCWISDMGRMRMVCGNWGLNGVHGMRFMGVKSAWYAFYGWGKAPDCKGFASAQ